MKKSVLASLLVLFAASGANAAPALPRVISEIFSYDCKFRFFEGEGVNSDRVSCPAGQHLGLYEADYKFYLYRHKDGSNFAQRGTSAPFPAPVCGLQLEKHVCERGEPRMEFGLSAYNEGVFNIAISLVPAPHLGGFISGYAAMLDPRGNCPDGLVKIRPYYAYPPSMLDPLPSNFINANGNLNSVVIATERPESFEVTRTPAETPCDARGRCRFPDGETHVASASPYVGASPVVCAVPPHMMQR